MWPFKKKEKKLLTLEGEEALNFIKNISSPQHECPPELSSSKLCVCMDCSKKGTCWAENWNRNVMGCQWFNRACSYKVLLESNGEKLSGYEKFILDPYYNEKYGAELMRSSKKKEIKDVKEKDTGTTTLCGD